MYRENVCNGLSKIEVRLFTHFGYNNTGKNYIHK